MKLKYSLAGILISYHISLILGCRMVCYYNTVSANREGLSRFTSTDLEFALQHCTHVIYDHVSIRSNTYEVTTITSQRKQELANMINLKKKYPNIKFLLSVSGDKSKGIMKSFLQLLEAHHQAKQTFVNSAVQTLHKYKFDGLSLDIQFPTIKPIKILTKFQKFWQDIKSFFHKSSEDDYNIDHTAQFTDLVQQLNTSLKHDNLLLTLNVLPNTKSELFFDIPAISKYMDFIILSAFDFYTPKRNPNEADYTAPIKPPTQVGHRLPNANVKYLVQEWHHQDVSRNKIIVGVATWGRSWKMTKESRYTGPPPIFFTEGPADGGPQTHTPGFLSWAEICQMLMSSSSEAKKDDANQWLRVVDPNMEYGNYAYNPVDKNGKHGVWISYEEPSTAALKAQYVRNHNLGGVALVDLALDDFHGQCTGDKFPILRAIKHKLEQ